MADSTPPTLGQAIDIVLGALSQLDEKKQRIVITSVVSSLGLTAPPDSTPPHGTGTGEENVAHPPAPALAATQFVSKDIRTLKEEKDPKGNLQMACLVAYYLKELAPAADRKEVIKGDDLEKYFVQAGFPLPKKPGQVMVDAKAAGYFDPINRGEYKLNAVGHNLVTQKMQRGAAA